MPNDKYVSPYLLRPLRNYEEALRDRQRRNPRVDVLGDAARERSSGGESAEAGNGTDATGSKGR